VEIELLASIIQGDERCRFLIRVGDTDFRIGTTGFYPIRRTKNVFSIDLPPGCCYDDQGD
jgi:hypothetical protein